MSIIANTEHRGGIIEATTKEKEGCLWRNPETCKACPIKYCQIKEGAHE